MFNNIHIQLIIIIIIITYYAHNSTIRQSGL